MKSGMHPELAMAESTMDYKQFIREFEKYRSVYPEQSVQKALDVFLEPQEALVNQPELVSP